jgi:hypothetical protein
MYAARVGTSENFLNFLPIDIGLNLRIGKLDMKEISSSNCEYIYTVKNVLVKLLLSWLATVCSVVLTINSQTKSIKSQTKPIK